MRGAANTFIENSSQFTQATKEEAENQLKISLSL
ncbi:hypothetical protein CF161_16596 [Pseudomonas sp. CF161]|nr:hypothetical protein CF161_16596 [Pseudomonas sp. CF161]